MADYLVAKALIAVQEVVGWLLVVVGVYRLIAIWPWPDDLPPVLIFGGVIVTGLSLIVWAQLARAQIAVAEQTAAILALMRAARQGPEIGARVPPPVTAQRPDAASR